MGEQVDVVSLILYMYTCIKIMKTDWLKSFTSPIARALIKASTTLVLMGGVWGGVFSTHSTALAIVSFVVFMSSAFQHSTPVVHLKYI